MITSLDHIAFSSCNVENDMKNFLGYELLFKETLPNLKIKENFLSFYQPQHELALLKCSNGYNIEILNHGQITDKDGYIKLVNQNKIVVKTNDIQKSKDFWSAIGFKEKEKGEMEFNTIFPTSVKLYLSFELSEQTDYKINDKGYNCIGLVTTSILKDIEKLKKLECEISEIQELTVNNKPMKICFAQRNLCEIIELIEIKRG